MLRILLIDDARAVRLVARLGLMQSGGVEVLEATGGEEGLAVASRALPDLILLDVNMPGMSGPETLRALRSDPRTAAIPVIFLTAEESRPRTDALRALGVWGVLQKPFDPRTLLAYVERCLTSAWGTRGAALEGAYAALKA